jgi:hypothetical protein
LSYESAQTSRSKSQQFFREITQTLESTMREARLWFRISYAAGVVHEVKRPAIDKVRHRRTGLALDLTKQAQREGLSV